MNLKKIGALFTLLATFAGAYYAFRNNERQQEAHVQLTKFQKCQSDLLIVKSKMLLTINDRKLRLEKLQSNSEVLQECQAGLSICLQTFESCRSRDSIPFEVVECAEEQQMTEDDVISMIKESKVTEESCNDLVENTHGLIRNIQIEISVYDSQIQSKTYSYQDCDTSNKKCEADLKECRISFVGFCKRHGIKHID